ncbi:MAG: phage tail tape measure protein [Quadrisphaera sp.]
MSALSIGSLVGYINLDASGFERTLGGVFDKLKDLGGKGPLIAAAAGGAIGLGLSAALAGAIDVQSAQAKLAGQLGLTSEESAKYGAIAGDLYSQNYGESLEGVNESIAAVVSSIDGIREASDADLQAAAKSAMNLASAFDIDVAGAARSAGLLVKNGLAKDTTEAFDLLTAGAQKVGPAMVEPLMDAVNEYGTNFAAIGASGQQAMSVLADAAANGEIALDKAGDAVKEFTIRGTDMSTSSVAAYKAIGLNAKSMSNALLAGGDTAKAATQKVIDGLQGIKDPATQANTAIALFGTPLEDIGTDKIPAFLSALEGTSNVLGEVGGSAQRLDATLGSTAAGNLESFRRQLETGFVTGVGGYVLPAVTAMVTALATGFGPAVEAAGAYMTNSLVPGLESTSTWMGDNSRIIGIVAGIITTLLLPALLAWGVNSTISAAASVTAWVTTQAAAVASGAAQVAALYAQAAGWVAAGGRAVAGAAMVVGGWVATGAAAVASGARSVAAFALTVAGWVASGVVAGVNAAIVVAGWVLMGTQAMLQAARMAAAWFIALGPIGWVTAAVIAIVALVIANWDTIKSATIKAWTATTDWVSKAWQAIVTFITDGLAAGKQFVIDGWNAIKAATSAAWNGIKAAVGQVLSWMVSAFLNFTGPGLLIKHWDTIVEAAKALPGRVKAGITALLSIAESIGSDIINGIRNGITNGAARVVSAAKDMALGALNGAKKALGIASPSKAFIEVGEFVNAGMVKGLTSTAKDVESATGKIADNVYKGFKDIVGNEVDAQTTAIQQNVEGLKKQVEALGKTAKAREANAKKIEALNAQIDALNARRKAMNDSIEDVVNTRSQALLTSIAAQTAALAGIAEQRDDVAERIKDATKNLEDAVKLRDDFAASIANSAEQIGALTGVKGLMGADGKEAAVSFQDIIAAMTGARVSVEGYQAALENLRRQGLNDDLFKQLADAGPAQGKAYVDAIIAAGPGAVEKLNQVQTDLASASQRLGYYTSRELYQAGVESAQGLLLGLTAKENELYAKAQQIADTIAETIRKALAIRSPSRVMAQIGRYVGEGLIVGMESMVPQVSASAAGLLSLPGVEAFTVGDASLAGRVTGGVRDAGTVMATLTPEDRALLAAVADRPVNLLTQDRVLAASVERAGVRFNKGQDRTRGLRTEPRQFL